ncbi:MAG: adenylate kinase [Elusimicrobia bacterium]|nr:adenylate kinase [Elusimicrobiota bacterium]
MLGIPGAGKGTQAKKLSDKLGIVHISTGDIFRNAAKDGSELGKKAHKIMTAGNLLPDEIVIGIVKERLSKKDAFDGYILDGFPRTLNQAQEFDKIEDLGAVISLTLEADEAVNRIEGRRSCGSCNGHFNVYLDKIETNKCPVCNEELTLRSDDTKDTIKVRIENYIKQTAPLEDYYSSKGILKEINGNQSVEDVYKDMLAAL